MTNVIIEYLLKIMKRVGSSAGSSTQIRTLYYLIETGDRLDFSGEFKA